MNFQPSSSSQESGTFRWKQDPETKTLDKDADAYNVWEGTKEEGSGVGTEGQPVPGVQ